MNSFKYADKFSILPCYSSIKQHSVGLIQIWDKDIEKTIYSVARW